MTSNPDHLERTTTEPRDRSLNTVVLQHIDEINDTTRIFRLGIPRGSPPFRFLPGQWLDVYVPGVERAGGFTITSTPPEARKAHPATTEPEGDTAAAAAAATVAIPDTNNTKDNNGNETAQAEGPYIELAVQKSPDSPPAAWLWREPPTSLLGAELRVRVGGSFVWPPPGINVRALRRVVFVAGGMGVNPLVSMLTSLSLAFSSSSSSSSTPAAGGGDGGLQVRFLYSLKDPGVPAEGEMREARKMLFLERIDRVFRQGRVKGRLEVFLTGKAGDREEEGEGEGEGENVIRCGKDADGHVVIPFHPRRCTVEGDVAKAVGDTPAERRFAVVYVCGVPTMTDDFVAKLTDRESGLGMEPHRVLCEKWW
ncbi:hypothetical protein F5Y10DRAFT_293381 [Nemania abortiva]|nr:hypothetical protein F5Y10DRAFT_293381 [Nemania abortiva]